MISKIKKISHEKGFASLFITILILAIMFGIAVSLIVLVLGQERITGNITKSSQSYYTAEAGIEDALLRLAKNLNWSSPYDLKVADGTSTVEISDVIGGKRTITSKGNFLNRIRKIQVISQISTQQISFYYGAQVGDEGLKMKNNSRIKGNVFSNGNAIGLDSNAFIDNSIVVARNGNRIEKLKIGQIQETIAPANALAFSCYNCQIKDILTYVKGGIVQGCIASEIKVQAEEIQPKDLPISYSQIQEWEKAAEKGGVINCPYSDPNINCSFQKGICFCQLNKGSSLGPIKIEANLVFPMNSLDEPVIINGPIWVKGNILAENNAGISLKDGLNSGYSIIADDPNDQINNGKIELNNNVVTEDSDEGGRLLFISANKSLDPNDPAILLKNNVNKDKAQSIVFSLQGLIKVENNVKFKQITGYGIYMENNAEIVYEEGLRDATFSSGPGGALEVISWKEIE